MARAAVRMKYVDGFGDSVGRLLGKAFFESLVTFRMCFYLGRFFFGGCGFFFFGFFGFCFTHLNDFGVRLVFGKGWVHSSNGSQGGVVDAFDTENLPIGFGL